LSLEGSWVKEYLLDGEGEAILKIIGEKMMRTLCVSVVLAVMVTSFTGVYAADEQKVDPRAKVLAVKGRMSKLKEDITSLQRSIDIKNTEYFQYQRKIEYKDGPISKIYHEMKKLEKQLLERRQDLNDELMKDEGAKKLIAERNALYQKQLVLREREQLLRNEMKAARLEAGAVAQKASN
jgi:hypothetical protein